tara:strand:- start:62 stop:484 length:423 start_codon:yes stop_codon:yes gene_type:complete
MKTNLKKVYKKMPNQKLNLKSKKVALGLLDEISYEYGDLVEEIDRLSYLVDEFLPKEFAKLDNAYQLLTDVLENNTENIIYYDDVAQDEETIRIIRQNAEVIGIGADELFPNIDNYESELERLRVLSDQFESAVRMFSTY